MFFFCLFLLLHSFHFQIQSEQKHTFLFAKFANTMSVINKTIIYPVIKKHPSYE